MDAWNRPAPVPSWRWIAAIWFGIGLFNATQTVIVMRAQGMQHDFVHLFLTLFLVWIPWVLATPFVLRLGASHPLLPFRSVVPWLRHFALCFLIALVASSWLAALEVWLNPWTPGQPPPAFRQLWSIRFYNEILSSIILYACILVVGQMLASRERLARQQAEAARLAEQLSRAQLSALRQQIEPHFLFNALNAVSALVREGRNPEAVRMIAGLGDLLRRSLDDSGRQEVRLGEELEFLGKYLEIQKVRFADRLQVEWRVPEELRTARVPVLILQPLVENAVKHGIGRTAEGGRIRVQAARSNGHLSLEIYNDGPPLPEETAAPGAGIGLSNVRSRLQTLYGDSFELRLRNEGARGVQALLSIPFKED